MVSGSQGKSEARWSTRTPPSAPARAASARQSVCGVLLNEATATVSPGRTTPSASCAVASRSRCRSRHDTGAASPAVGRLSRRSGRRIAASAMLETALHSHLAARGAVHAAERGVELAEPGEPLALIGVEGRAAARLLPDGARLAPYAHAVVTLAGVAVRAQRASEVGGPGFVLHVPAARAAAVWDALAAAGARPCGMEALESRRVEVGVPRIGVDMDGATLALEVPVEDAISTTKGCYLGQEVVARGTARRHVNRRLVGLRLEGPEPPPGAPLVREGKEAGRLTAVARAFGAGGLAALGFVRRDCWEPGTELRVRHGHAVTLARVAELPLA